MTDKNTGKIADVHPFPRSDNTPRRKVFVRDLIVDAFIGAYEHEMGRTQPVIINLEMQVSEPANPLSDNLDDIVCYDKITQAIIEIINEEHIKLVETLAERIAAMCLAHKLAISVRVSVDKPNAIANAAGAGVEIFRNKNV